MEWMRWRVEVQGQKSEVGKGWTRRCGSLLFRVGEPGGVCEEAFVRIGG